MRFPIAVAVIAILATILAVQSQQAPVERAAVYIAEEFRLVNHKGEPVWGLPSKRRNQRAPLAYHATRGEQAERLG